MARLLVFAATVDGGKDPKLTAGQFQPGMVITIINDDEKFGDLDIGPHSTVVECSGVDKLDMMHLCSPKIAPTPYILGEAAVIAPIRIWKANNVEALKVATPLKAAKGDLKPQVQAKVQAFLDSNFTQVADVVAVDPAVIG